MKQQAIQYVALDVHQATLVVAVRNEQGSVVMRATVATETTAIQLRGGRAPTINGPMDDWSR